MRVGTLVPDVFKHYLRLFHPAWAPDQPVRWEQVAAHTQRTLHPEAFFFFLAGGHRSSEPGFAWRLPVESGLDRPPDQGFMPRHLMARLAAHLGPATLTPDDIWMCQWNGHGSIPRGIQERYGLVRGEHREYILYHGSMETVLGLDPPPDFFWPRDRAWVVATDVDLDSTFIGGAWSAMNAILADTELETLEVRADSRYDLDGDSVNES